MLSEGIESNKVYMIDLYFDYTVASTVDARPLISLLPSACSSKASSPTSRTVSGQANRSAYRTARGQTTTAPLKESTASRGSLCWSRWLLLSGYG